MLARHKVRCPKKVNALVRETGGRPDSSQTLDPPGIGARDLQECLQIQLDYLTEEGKGNPFAERMVRSYFRDVVNKRYAKIARSISVIRVLFPGGIVCFTTARSLMRLANA